MSLLQDDHWQTQYDLSMALYMQRAECESINTHHDTAAKIFTTALTHARTRLEKFQVHHRQLILYSTPDKFAAALPFGFAGLRLFGIKCSATVNKLTLIKEMARTRWSLRHKTPAQLYHLPQMTCREKQAVMTLLMHMTLPAFFNNNRNLLGWLVMRTLNMSLKTR